MFRIFSQEPTSSSSQFNDVKGGIEELNRLAHLSFENGEFTKAYDLFTKCSKDAPDCIDYQFNAGVSAMRAKLPQAAEKCFKFIINQDCDKKYIAEAYFRLGSMQCEKNKIDQAIQYFHSALEHDVNHFVATEILGNCYAGLGQYENARFYFNQCRVYGKNTSVYTKEALMLHKNGDTSKALSLMQEISEQFPENVELRTQRAAFEKFSSDDLKMKSKFAYKTLGLTGLQYLNHHLLNSQHSFVKIPARFFGFAMDTGMVSELLNNTFCSEMGNLQRFQSCIMQGVPLTKEALVENSTQSVFDKKSLEKLCTWDFWAENVSVKNTIAATTLFCNISRAIEVYYYNSKDAGASLKKFNDWACPIIKVVNQGYLLWQVSNQIKSAYDNTIKVNQVFTWGKFYENTKVSVNYMALSICVADLLDTYGTENYLANAYTNNEVCYSNDGFLLATASNKTLASGKVALIPLSLSLGPVAIIATPIAVVWNMYALFESYDDLRYRTNFINYNHHLKNRCLTSMRAVIDDLERFFYNMSVDFVNARFDGFTYVMESYVDSLLQGGEINANTVRSKIEHSLTKLDAGKWRSELLRFIFETFVFNADVIEKKWSDAQKKLNAIRVHPKAVTERVNRAIFNYYRNYFAELFNKNDLKSADKLLSAIMISHSPDLILPEDSKMLCDKYQNSFLIFLSLLILETNKAESSKAAKIIYDKFIKWIVRDQKLNEGVIAQICYDCNKAKDWGLISELSAHVKFDKPAESINLPIALLRSLALISLAGNENTQKSVSELYLKEAKHILSLVLEKQPQSSDAYILMRDIAMQEGDSKKFYLYYKSAHALKEKEINALKSKMKEKNIPEKDLNLKELCEQCDAMKKEISSIESHFSDEVNKLKTEITQNGLVLNAVLTQDLGTLENNIKRYNELKSQLKDGLNESLNQLLDQLSKQSATLMDGVLDVKKQAITYLEKWRSALVEHKKKIADDFIAGIDKASDSFETLLKNFEIRITEASAKVSSLHDDVRQSRGFSL